MHRPPTSHRALRLGLALVSVVLLSALTGGPALAKETSCADQVVADWYDDGRVGKIYPLECYRQAIKILPPDVLDYSNAKEEIGRALAFAKQGKPDPGGEDPTPPATTSTGSAGTTKTDTTRTSTTKTSTTKTSTTKTSTTKTSTTETDTTDTTDTSTTDTSGPSSVPVPLLVLGGLAVLLLAAGSAGYLRRRMDSDGDGDGTPPTTT